MKTKIEEFKQKYGMEFQEFFDCVESFSCLQKLMEKYDIEEVLRDSLVWGAGRKAEEIEK